MTHYYKIRKDGRYFSAINMDTQQVEYGGINNVGGINGKSRKAVIQKAMDMVEKPAILYLWYISWYEVKNEGVTKPDNVSIIQYSTEIGEIEHGSDLRHDHKKSDIPDFTHGNEQHDLDFSIVGHEHYRSEIANFFGSPFWSSIPDKPSTYPPSTHNHVETDITNLVHDAQKIKGKEVDDSAIGNDKVLKYNSSSGKLEYGTGGTGGMEIHGNEYHDPDFSPVGHSHSESEVTGLITDLASKETPSGSQEKVDAHKDLNTGVHGVGAGIIAKVADIATDNNLSSDAQDAISKKHMHSNQTLLDSYTQTEVNIADAVTKRHSNTLDHSHSNQTLLDSYTQTETNLADAVSKKHVQVHGSGDHTGTIGTPTQVGLANVTNDSQLKRADGDINSFTVKTTPVGADILLIEDSAASFAKKKITIGTLPSGGGGIEKGLTYHRKLGTTRFECWYSCFNTVTALTTGALTANRFYAFPFVVPKTITLDRIAINVTTAGTGNARWGIYDNDDTVGMYPNSRILDAGEISIATTGIKSVTINQQLTTGLYWLVLVSNGAPTLRAFAILSITPLLGYSASLGAEVSGVGIYVSFTYAALPATYPTTSPTIITAVPIPAIFVRVSA